MEEGKYKRINNLAATLLALSLVIGSFTLPGTADATSVSRPLLSGLFR